LAVDAFTPFLRLRSRDFFNSALAGSSKRFTPWNRNKTICLYINTIFK
jgi:hypothetical protein